MFGRCLGRCLGGVHDVKKDQPEPSVEGHGPAAPEGRAKFGPVGEDHGERDECGEADLHVASMASMPHHKYGWHLVVNHQRICRIKSP